MSLFLGFPEFAVIMVIFSLVGFFCTRPWTELDRFDRLGRGLRATGILYGLPVVFFFGVVFLDRSADLKSGQVWLERLTEWGQIFLWFFGLCGLPLVLGSLCPARSCE